MLLSCISASAQSDVTEDQLLGTWSNCTQGQFVLGDTLELKKGSCGVPNPQEGVSLTFERDARFTFSTHGWIASTSTNGTWTLSGRTINANLNYTQNTSSQYEILAINEDYLVLVCSKK